MKISPVASFMILAVGIAASGCSSLRIEHVDFGWPVESVLTVNNSNVVTDGRYATSFSVAKVAIEEFGDSLALMGKQVRLLRSSEGYYYFTGSKFKTVYVFRPDEQRLQLHATIEIPGPALKAPAFNLRTPYVELVDDGGIIINLMNDRIAKEEKK